MKLIQGSQEGGTCLSDGTGTKKHRKGWLAFESTFKNTHFSFTGYEAG